MLAPQTPPSSPALDAYVQSFLDRRDLFLDIAARHGSPLYVIEEQALWDRAHEFIRAFQAEWPAMRVFFPVKTNAHPLVLAAGVKAGLSLDVSSGLELSLALEANPKFVVFSGPAKTDDELTLAIRHRDRVTILLDSPCELGRLESLASQADVRVCAGVRLTTDERGLWRKFGIPLADLAGFMDQAQACPHVDLKGLQFHTSWNLTPAAHVTFIKRLGGALSGLSPAQRERIEFIDMGGGYWPLPGQWLPNPLPTDPHARLNEQGLVPVHELLPADPIGIFARQIGQAVRTHLFPHVRCRIDLEPGRWICNDALHLILTVLDRKGDDIAITDAGTNTVGWEKFESEYFPVINLSRPDWRERPFHVLGSLCTPHDVWGYGYYGSDIRRGDVLLIPTQGAYTYSLRQSFIKPLPRTVMIRADGTTEAWVPPNEDRLR